MWYASESPLLILIYLYIILLACSNVMRDTCRDHAEANTMCGKMSESTRVHPGPREGLLILPYTAVASSEFPECCRLFKPIVTSTRATNTARNLAHNRPATRLEAMWSVVRVMPEVVTALEL